MGLDLRLPLGLMFSTIGLIMLVYGLLTWGSSQYAQYLGMNVNAIWGAVLLVFGGLVFLLGWRSRGGETPPSNGVTASRRHRS